jgi:uncharacterized membrane protein YoaK (UPF0700 family)
MGWALSSDRDRVLVPVLFALTFVTGLVDAVSVLGLGRVFTANMTGNVVFLGFAAAGSPGWSVARPALALLTFCAGALIGGRIGTRIGVEAWRPPTVIAVGAEAVLLLMAAALAAGGGVDLVAQPGRLYTVMALTAVAMGMRNAVVRKLAVPDLTTTVLTLTLTGLAADSPLAGGQGARWSRRLASVALMFAGAAAGAWLAARSVALPLAAAGLISAACAARVKMGGRAAS